MSMPTSSSMDLRVLVIEDDPRYRRSLETLLANAPGVTLVASFAAAEPAIAWIDQQDVSLPTFDAVLMDIALPGASGIDATTRVRARFPSVTVVMLTVFEEPGTILQAICAGANGYLLKRASARELLTQLRSIATGGTPMTSGVARTVLDLLRRGSAPVGAPGRLDLTDREQDVLRCLVRGLSYKQAAAELDVSLDTVRSHIRALYKKLQVHSVAAAVTRAIRDQLV
jgi:DNA-binding NarL/FixJ family response regulator